MGGGVKKALRVVLTIVEEGNRGDTAGKTVAPNWREEQRW